MAKKSSSRPGHVDYHFHVVPRTPELIQPTERRYIRDRVYQIRGGARTPSIRGRINHELLKCSSLHGAVFLHRQTAEDFEAGRPGRRAGLIVEIVDENGVLAFSQPDLSATISWARQFEAESHLRNFAVTDARMLDERADAVFHPVIGETVTDSYLKFLGFRAARGRVPSALERHVRQVAPSNSVRWLAKDLTDPDLLRRERDEADRIAWATEAAEQSKQERQERQEEFEFDAQQERLKHELKPASLTRGSRTKVKIGFEKMPSADNPGARATFLGIALEFSEFWSEQKDSAKNVLALRRKR